AVVVGDCNGNAGSHSFLYLGQVNNISADTVAVARQKTDADLRFNPAYANIAPYPTLNLQGFTTTRASVLTIGDGVGNTGTTTGTGIADLSGGTVTASVDTIHVGRSSSSGAGGNATTGTLTSDAGTIAA